MICALAPAGRAATLRARPPPRPPPPPPHPAWRATHASRARRRIARRCRRRRWGRPPSPRRNPRRRRPIPPLPRRACAATEPRWCSRRSAAAPPRAGPTLLRGRAWLLRLVVDARRRRGQRERLGRHGAEAGRAAPATPLARRDPPRVVVVGRSRAAATAAAAAAAAAVVPSQNA